MFRFNPFLFVIALILLIIGGGYLIAGPFITELIYKNDVISYEGVIVSYGYYLNPADDKTYIYNMTVDVDGEEVEVYYTSYVFMDYDQGQKVTVYELNDYRALDSQQVYNDPQKASTFKFITIIGFGVLVAAFFKSVKYNWVRELFN